MVPFSSSLFICWGLRRRSIASYKGLRYGFSFCDKSPGRKPRDSPASTTGRVMTILFFLPLNTSSKAYAMARNVFPVPAGPEAKMI